MAGFDPTNAEQVNKFKGELNDYFQSTGHPTALALDGKIDDATKTAWKTFKSEAFTDGMISIGYLRDTLKLNDDGLKALGITDPTDPSKFDRQNPPPAAVEALNTYLQLPSGTAYKSAAFQDAVKTDKRAHWINDSFNPGALAQLDHLNAYFKAKTFAFDKPLDKDAVVNAIFEVDHEGWEKDLKDWTKKNEADPTTAGPKPDRAEPVKNTYANLSGEQALMSYASSGTMTEIPAAGTRGQLSPKQAKLFGAALLRVEKDQEGPTAITKRPDVTVIGMDGKGYPLEPKELTAYLQKASVELKGAAATDPSTYALKPVDVWVREKNIGLTGAGQTDPSKTIENGTEKILIETSPGQSRCVGNGIITKGMDGYYGGIYDVTTGDGDKLDVYLTKDIYNSIVNDKKPYDGHVFVMQQMKKEKGVIGVDELKVGYAKDANEFRDVQKSTWDLDDPKYGADNIKGFNTNQGPYLELTQEQYKDLKAEIKKKPDITLQEFIDIEKVKFPDLKATTFPPIPVPESKESEKKPAATEKTTADFPARDDDALIDYALGKSTDKDHNKLIRGNHRWQKEALGNVKDLNILLQKSLNTYVPAVDRIKEDGQFGKGTFDRVEEYQEVNHLKKDGIVGIETMTALQADEVTGLLGALVLDKTLTTADKTELNKELKDVQTLVSSGQPITDAAKAQVNNMLDELKKYKLDDADQILGQTIKDIRAHVPGKSAGK